METHLKPKVLKVKILFMFLAFVILLVGGGNLSFAVTPTLITGGLISPIGIALDEPNNHLYFVEYTPGTLKRVDLADPSFPVTDIATDLPKPVGLVLDMDHGLAYVTTNNLEGHPPNTGALWKVEISTGAKTLLTFNMGAPKQIVLDLANNEAYTVGYDDGRLRRIDLSTGAKIPVYKALNHPVGIVITKDAKYAYVCEQGPPQRIVKIDLIHGFNVGTVTDSFTTPPFFLAWTDSSENSLYVAERGVSPLARKISRVDLLTSAKNEAIQGSELPGQPFGIAVSGQGSSVYISLTNQIIKFDLVDLIGLGEPVFMAVGHVPVSAITPEGYADTLNLLPGYFYQVQHCPFGGMVNIFGNFNTFVTIGAKYYAIAVTKGASISYLQHSWIVARWDSTDYKYKPFTMLPALDGYKYEIPVEESDGTYHADLWWYPFWIMRWPSGENGEYTFQIKLYDVSGNEILPAFLPASFNSNNSLLLYVDNTPPEAKINEIFQTPNNPIEACEIVDKGNNEFYFNITAYDANQHLLGYHLNALWGDNDSRKINSEFYSSHVAGPPNYAWSGIINQDVWQDDPPGPFQAECCCAHTFYLRVWKRTINGYNYILRRHYHKSITINNVFVPGTIPPERKKCIK